MPDISITDVTNSSNTGVFDVLMEAVNADINEQFQANRLTGQDYANVYLGSMQAVLAESIRYVLQQNLVNEQIKTAYVERTMKDKETAKLGLDNVMKQSEASRDGDDTFVYSPRYEDTP